MKRIIAFICFILNIGIANASTKHQHPEKYYQELDCTGELEVKFDDGTRADCLDDEYATEYDYAYNGTKV